MEKTIEYNKKTVTILLHIFQNFIDSHTTPIQLFFHIYLLFWPYYNSNIIRHLIIITYLFIIINIFINTPYPYYSSDVISSLPLLIPTSAFTSLLVTNYESSSLRFFSKTTPPQKNTLCLFAFFSFKNFVFYMEYIYLNNGNKNTHQIYRINIKYHHS